MELRHNILLSLFALGGACLSAQADGYVIYPVPQSQVATSGNVMLSPGKIQVICGEKIDQYTKNRIQNILEEHGLFSPGDNTLFSATPSDGFAHIYLGVNGSGDLADKAATRLNLSREVFEKKAKYDRHIVNVAVGSDGEPEIVILGEHTDAAFIALASIEQILDNYKGSGYTIPCGTIYDYADQQNRGIVEGYYGVPYSAEVKKDLMRFMMRFKMNSYMYGAKSDPYHSTYWTSPYPTTITSEQKKMGYLTQDMLRDITNVSHETKVNFIWAIHPGNAFLGSSTVVDDIMSKYKKMYDLGIRQFAVFVDDVSIPSTNEQYELNATRISQIQKAIESQWNNKNLEPIDTVKPIQFVPQIYCSSFAGGGESQRKAFFEALAKTPSNIAIYTTGWGVWSVPNSSDVQQVRQYLGRDVAWWWNYPCNDNDADKLFPMDMYTNFKDESRIANNARPDTGLEHCLGVLSNPMQQGEVAKIALFGVADYAWNNDAFNNTANWNAAFPAIFNGDAVKANALQKLSSYLRYYDSDALSSLVNSYKATINKTPNSSKLLEELNQVVEAAAHISALKDSKIESDRLLYVDLAPWLSKVSDMAKVAATLVGAVDIKDDDATKWANYYSTIGILNKMDSNSAYMAPQLAGSVGSNLSLTTTNAHPANVVLAPFVEYMKENALGDMLKGDKLTRPAVFSNLANPKGSINTSKLPVVFINNSYNKLGKGDYIGIELTAASHLSAVNMADTLRSNYAILISENGKNWSRYPDGLDGYVKYICVLNESDEIRNVYLSRNVLSVELPAETKLVPSATTIPSGEIYSGHGASYLTDGDYSTWTCLNRNQQNNDAYTVKLSAVKPIGDVRICMGTTNGDYMNVGRVQISRDGKKWTDLKVKGTNTYDFRMTLPQVTKYSGEMSYCDFAGTGDSAQYVRLYVKQANTNKWLRLYEIEVNRESDVLAYASDVDIQGVRETSLNDGLGYTGLDATAVPENAELIYYFYNNRAVEAVKIFSGTEGNAQATIDVSDDGQNWSPVAQYSNGLQVVDLTAHPMAHQMRIKWTGAAPEIFEIKEILSESEGGEVTGISSPVLTTSDENIRFDVTAGRVRLISPQGIGSVRVYTTDGRNVMTLETRGSNEVTLPKIAGDNIYIVVAKDVRGTATTAKITF